LQNLWGYSTDDSDLPPTNGPGGLAFGSAVSFNNAQQLSTSASFPDPSSGFTHFNVASDARLLSACMRLTYTGRMADTSGELAFIENLPLDVFLGDDKASWDVANPASVDDLFKLATAVQRMGVDTAEIVHRPDDAGGSVFRDARDGALVLERKNNSYLPTEIETNARVLQPHVFGFAWRSVGDGGARVGLTFDFIKNLEWRPRPIIGFTSAVPRAIGPADGVSVHRVLQALDARSPAWTRRILDSAGSLAGEVVRMAATGIGKAALSYGKNAGRAAIAGLLL
jgi:hypothetical protein